jgi:GR25 family glycosyltransferase involved in LPS biosynthesis
MSFNVEIYKMLNPDLRFKKLNDYEKHYMMIGKKQGRPIDIYSVYPEFNIDQYRANYADLHNLSNDEVVKHWITSGNREGRVYVQLNKFGYINGIDMIYWINLDRSSNRKADMERILNKLSVPNTRIRASDGKLENVREYFINTLVINNNGEYGCLLSHLRTIKQFWESGLERCLILEDDITLDFMKYWKKDINTVINEAPNDWEVIGMTQTLDSSSNIAGDYTPFWDYFFSAQGYIINRSGAQKIMSLYKLDKWELNIDYHTSEKVIYGNTKMYVYKYPYFTYSLYNNSTIHINHSELHRIAKENSVNMWLT